MDRERIWGKKKRILEMHGESVETYVIKKFQRRKKAERTSEGHIQVSVDDSLSIYLFPIPSKIWRDQKPGQLVFPHTPLKKLLNDTQNSYRYTIILYIHFHVMTNT